MRMSKRKRRKAAILRRAYELLSSEGEEQAPGVIKLEGWFKTIKKYRVLPLAKCAHNLTTAPLFPSAASS